MVEVIGRQNQVDRIKKILETKKDYYLELLQMGLMMHIIFMY